MAAVCASSSRDGLGLARKPKTRVWVKVAPPRGEVRRTNVVAWAAASAAVVKTCCMAVTTCARVVMRKLLCDVLVSDISIMPQ